MVANRIHPCSGENIRYHDHENAGVSPRGQHATRTVSDSNGVHFMPNQKGGQA